MQTQEVIPAVSVNTPRSLALATRQVSQLAHPTFAAGLREVGLDWTASKQVMKLDDGTAISGHRAVRRDDNGHVLGIVGHKYGLVQNRDMAGSLDELFSGDLAGLASLDRGGTFDGGKTVYLLAKMPDQLTLRLFNGVDEIRPYLCFVDGKVGNKALRCFPTTVRVVCQNTLRLALKQDGADGFTIRHNGGIAERQKEAIAAMREFGAAIKKHHEAMEFLSRKHITPQFIETLVADEILAPEGGKERTAHNKKKVATIIELIETGVGTNIPGVKGTAYGVFQAVTEFSSHYAPARGTLAEQSETRLEKVLAGNGLNQRALEVLLAA